MVHVWRAKFEEFFSYCVLNIFFETFYSQVFQNFFLSSFFDVQLLKICFNQTFLSLCQNTNTFFSIQKYFVIFGFNLVVHFFDISLRILLAFSTLLFGVLFSNADLWISVKCENAYSSRPHNTYKIRKYSAKMRKCSLKMRKCSLTSTFRWVMQMNLLRLGRLDNKKQ